MNLKIYCNILCVLFFSLGTSSVLAREKISWLDEIKNLRWAVDISARGSYNAENNHLSHQESLGLDVHKVFTSAEGGDIGTLIFQGYFTKLNNVEPYPPFFKNETDLKFICRICNFNLTILDRGKLNFRVGHAEIPFGLEYNLDSNGTLRQYSNVGDLGHKLDWGIAANGKFSWGGYEVSLSRGTGVDWTGDYGSYIASGRVEISDDYSSFLGFSAFYGRLKANNNSLSYIDRTRIGIDASTQIALFTFLAEVSLGKDDNTEKINSLLEVDIHNNTETLLTYLQLKNMAQQVKNKAWESKQQIRLGAQYTLNRFWAVSTQWTHDVTVLKGAERASIIEVQLRYRF